MTQTASSLLIILLGMYGLRLAFTGQLIYYIHPRYVTLTIAACVLLIIIGVIAYTFIPQPKESRRRKATSLAHLAPIIALVVVGALVPARPLGSATAIQRAGTLPQPQAQTSEVGSEVSDVREIDTSDWTFDDWWYSLVVQDRNIDHYADKPAKLIGFVTHPKTAPPDTFYLTRFLLMCCAIDAQPVGFWVQKTENGAPELKNDEWVEVKGILRVTEYDGKKTLFLEPESITAAEQPEDPYVY